MDGMLIELFDVDLSPEKSETEVVIALIGNRSPWMSGGKGIMVRHEGAAEQGEADAFPIPVEREDIWRYDADRIPVVGHMGPITQWQFAAVVSADQLATHNAVGTLPCRPRQRQCELEYLVLFHPTDMEQELNIIHIGVKSPFGSEPACSYPSDLNECHP